MAIPAFKTLSPPTSQKCDSRGHRRRRIFATDDARDEKTITVTLLCYRIQCVVYQNDGQRFGHILTLFLLLKVRCWPICNVLCELMLTPCHSHGILTLSGTSWPANLDYRASVRITAARKNYKSDEEHPCADQVDLDLAG